MVKQDQRFPEAQTDGDRGMFTHLSPWLKEARRVARLRLSEPERLGGGQSRVSNGLPPGVPPGAAARLAASCPECSVGSTFSDEARPLRPRP